MASIKYTAHVAVIFFEDGKNIVKFVTSIDHENRSAIWAAGKPAMKFSEAAAKDLVLGLTLNCFNAVVVKSLNGDTLVNPEA